MQSTQVSIAANTTGLVTVQGLRPDATTSTRSVSCAARPALPPTAPHVSTWRSPGSTFTFGAEDLHLDDNSSTGCRLPQTLQNMPGRQAGLYHRPGDNSMGESAVVEPSCCAPSPRHRAECYCARCPVTRRYFENMPTCLSSRCFGNHDGESGWTAPQSPTGLRCVVGHGTQGAVPQSKPDRFYSGSSVPATGVGLRQNYAAFEWGDALFIDARSVIPYQTKPGN